MCFQAEDGIRDLVRSRGLGDVYKRQVRSRQDVALIEQAVERLDRADVPQIEQHLVPEAGVQQVQHGMLDTAHVQIDAAGPAPVSYTHPRAHETVLDLVCRLLLEKNK